MPANLKHFQENCTYFHVLFGGKNVVYADKNVFMRDRLTKFLCDNYDNFHTQPHSINRAL